MCVCMCVREREAKKYLAFLLVFTCVYVCDACVSLREKERERGGGEEVRESER